MPAQSLTEKYRPKTLQEIKGNSEVIECLSSFSVEEMPNILFYGPPGTGKTTAIHAFLASHPRHFILELNASDDRGINTVRNQIKEFASIKSSEIKVVVLDEADSMSRDAQNALRRIMEDFPQTRFCLICNFYRKIIDPILSRCTKMRFAPVATASRVIEVCRREGIDCEEEGARLLEKYSDGDMRKVLNDLEGIKGSYGAVTKKNILEFFRMCDEDIFDELFEAFCVLPYSKSLEMVSKYDVDCSGLINAFVERISKRKDRLELSAGLADIEYRISKGLSESLQLKAVIALFRLSQVQGSGDV